MKRLFAILSLLAIGPFVGVNAFAEDDSAQPRVVNHLTMNQWVRTEDGGQLTGRVFLPGIGGKAEALKGVTVAMKSRDGQVLRATTDAKGMFELSDVSSGVYALTARGENVFACCAMHVVDSSMSADVELPSQADIAVANVDYTVVNTAVIRYMPVNSQSLESSLESAKLDVLKDRIRSQDVFRVVQTEGGMKGRIHVAGAKFDALGDAQLTNVFLFKDGMEIDRKVTDQLGAFSFANVATGNYSIMAIGPDGIGLIGFELVDANVVSETASNVGADGTQLVGFGLFGNHHNIGNQCCCEEFAIQVAPCPEVVTCVEEVIIQEAPIVETIVDQGCGCGVPGEVMEGEVVMDGYGTPLNGGYGGGFGGGGGFSGGGGGFGGGGGGFGGIGGLAGLAATGAIIAATTSNDDNNAIVAPGVTSQSLPSN
ncbi:hypothetical protein Poly51_19900 [Rubripirellula tenax]|uniref:Cna protein B-type domain protein n=1 Tax=Rubripirellula tenax TaxID=2528015 RepID=A0A5C6FGA3_9BACT|nr:carboxypeptidase-like regulatory domain-containing protein [Rubripirellula tenax]TWU59204.1 hypothetical protein Poly51_19900 [Rubripirellula tenax]